MNIKFWGVRGSIPVPGPATVRYGGNTSCLEVTGAHGECIILDAGSGIRPLGLDLMTRAHTLPHIHLFISHTHWDHIQGFPFFVPAYIPGTRIDVKGPVHFMESKTLQEIFDMQMHYEFFPVSNEQLAADITYASLKETTLRIGRLTIESIFTNHPILSLGYKITEDGQSLFYTGDHEPYHNVFEEWKQEYSPSDEEDLLFGDVDTTVDNANERFVNFIRGVDVFIADSQYTPQEYREARKNWGHSSWDYCLQWMAQASPKRMILMHHDPLRSDEQMDANMDAIRESAVRMKLNPNQIHFAREGMEIQV